VAHPKRLTQLLPAPAFSSLRPYVWLDRRLPLGASSRHTCTYIETNSHLRLEMVVSRVQPVKQVKSEGILPLSPQLPAVLVSKQRNATLEDSERASVPFLFQLVA